MIEFPMKQLLTIMFVCGAAFAQTKSAPATKATTAAKRPAPARSLLDPSTMKTKAPETFKAKFTTTQGDFVLQVTRAWAPIGADRFYNLVRGKFFDGSPFFRVIPGFMVQFGHEHQSEGVVRVDDAESSGRAGEAGE